MCMNEGRFDLNNDADVVALGLTSLTSQGMEFVSALLDAYPNYLPRDCAALRKRSTEVGEAGELLDDAKDLVCRIRLALGTYCVETVYPMIRNKRGRLVRDRSQGFLGYSAGPRLINALLHGEPARALQKPTTGLEAQALCQSYDDTSSPQNAQDKHVGPGVRMSNVKS